MDTSSDSTNGAQNFIGHVLKFDEDTKQELMNVAQYTALAIIPITIYNHLVNSVIPELDETKGNIELLIEVLGEMLFVLIGLFLIHRLVTFANTYSGKSYGTFNIFTIILLYLVICQDQSSNVGSKIKGLYNPLEKKSDKIKKLFEKEIFDQTCSCVLNPMFFAGHRKKHYAPKYQNMCGVCWKCKENLKFIAESEKDQSSL